MPKRNIEAAGSRTAPARRTNRKDDANSLFWWVGIFNNERATFTLKDKDNNGSGIDNNRGNAKEVRTLQQEQACRTQQGDRKPDGWQMFSLSRPDAGSDQFVLEVTNRYEHAVMAGVQYHTG